MDQFSSAERKQKLADIQHSPHPAEMAAMKYSGLALIVLFFASDPAVYNQVIRGTVLDCQTHKRVPEALVYFSGTFVSTGSDKNGRFELDISEFSSMPVTISAPGYYSMTITIVTPAKPVLVNLTPKEKRIGIYSSEHDRNRKENLRLFRTTFLGTTRNAHKCKILNEDDIGFISETGSDTLKVFCPGPLLIDNMALGYRAVYFLDDFELCRKKGTFLLSGNISFSRDLATESTGNDGFAGRRKEAYLGSRMYFFRLLWNNSLDSAGYMVKNSDDEYLNCGQITRRTDSLAKYLKCPFRQIENQAGKTPSYYIVFREADLIYDKKGNPNPHYISVIYAEQDIYFDKNGYFDPANISWQGKMARQRLADMLPFEYPIK